MRRTNGAIGPLTTRSMGAPNEDKTPHDGALERLRSRLKHWSPMESGSGVVH